MKTIKHNSISSLIIIAVVFLLIFNTTLGYIMTEKARSALISVIRERMLDISNTAAAMIDGDDLVSLTAGDMDSSEYREIMRMLTYFQDNIELDYIYCIRDMGNKNFVFSVDPTVEDPGEFGSSIVYTDALYEASLGRAAVDKEPYTDEWGTFYSAYSPVFTSDGKVAGIVAVDFSADWFNDQVRDLVIIVIHIGVASMVAGIKIILVISYRRRKRYRKVNDNLNELAGRIEELVREIECGSVCDISRIDAEDIIDEDIGKTDDIDLLGDKILKMQDHIREHISLIHEMAYIDALTGVRNKSAYLETIKNLNGKIKEQATDFAVAVFDLNGLKEINDNQGHVLGDIAISDAAACLKAAFKTDNLYRIGGDEFICIIIKPRPDEIAECFRRLEHEIAGVNKMDRAYKVELGISKGAARYEAGIDNDFISVFKRADQAMYDDKRNYYLSHGDRRRNRINTDRQNDEK